MKKYLISIETVDSQRLNNLFEQSIFKSYKDEFTKVGVRGIDLPILEYYKMGVARQIEPLSPGELGCTLSHVKSLRDFINSNEKYALIIEDDIIQINHFDLNSLEEQIEKLNLSECFLFSLCGIQLKINNQVRGIKLEKLICGKHILKLHPYYISKFSYACAYIVDKSMAKLLVDYHEIPHIYDHWGGLRYLSKNYNFYATHLFEHPEITGNYLYQSSLESERLFKGFKPKFKKNKLNKFLDSLIKFILKKTNSTYY
ncbi:glycosyltransferase family 25 protein [Acinetobacter kookii]|uniref:Glycosyl transferase, family 25 n=1 Tax=Acinetobacter kookii TaxID=1226327 RepID=A0A1G6N396_9GAMM|nr:MULTISPECIES: glycosyltransferase family 25 protein [Acinetobacter]TCB68099.1 glycosyl transferase family 25 [Acinetobacter sp. ANC 4216]SDC62309.1 glycosyl transferase, family 25 [Acinetobacter kookii]